MTGKATWESFVWAELLPSLVSRLADVSEAGDSGTPWEMQPEGGRLGGSTVNAASGARDL